MSEPKYQTYKVDTQERVCFYEQEFYVLSNFSSFQIEWNGQLYPTLEHAYHVAKFHPEYMGHDDFGKIITHIQYNILMARSAHDAFKVANANKQHYRTDWNDIKVSVMADLLRLKVDQHEYVRKKLLETGDRELVEDSWRDDYWGWGPNKDGQNMLGKLWMQIRDEVRANV